MLTYLGAAARDARIKAKRLQVHVEAELGVDQGTIRRFEQGERWPRHIDETIAAYGRDLDIDPRDIWKDAIARWEADQ